MGRPRKIDNIDGEIENESLLDNEVEVTSEKESDGAKSEVVDMTALMDIVKKQNEIIESQKKALEKLIETKSTENKSENNSNENAIMLELLQTLKTNTKRDVVRVIHLDDVAQAYFKLSNGNIIRFNHYGQIQPMSIIDAELLLNQYKATFMRGALTFDTEHLYMIEECGIDTSKINYKPMECIEKISEMSNSEIKAMVLGFQPYQREMLKSYILNELAKDKNFIDMETLRYLNKLHKNIYKSQQGGYEFIMDRLIKLGVED